MNLNMYETSIHEKDGVRFFLARNEFNQKVFCVQGQTTRRFQGDWHGDILVGPLSDVNANHLRKIFPYLRPTTLGLQTSAGTGDRLGLATPGHVAAFRTVGGDIAPIFAQQSMRENARTLRPPRKVMDDALWGLMLTGWDQPWGADADHLKTLEDVQECGNAGYTFFTVDPFDYVDNEAHNASNFMLEQKMAQLPWEELDSSEDDLMDRFLNKAIHFDQCAITFDRLHLMRAACKYGKAIAHAKRMYKKAVEKVVEQPWEMEISVDETETPTSPLEHCFIVQELLRLGVEFVSLAPRFVGRFEKGVDYIGNLHTFETELRQHAAVQKHFGNYKLSIHSGSDKFSVYPYFAEFTEGKVHLKTAGTSYLEALRVMAMRAPAFFREIAAFSYGRYEIDRATYHVSGELENVPKLDMLNDEELTQWLDQFDARQVLHVTYGSALEQFGGQLLAKLDQ
ncbi:MAG: tagaturonate epimerase family protein [Anaerolineae bacterium]|nr:tagaturonate epimerase family protein [Anaerolineae bacterium]